MNWKYAFLGLVVLLVNACNKDNDDTPILTGDVITYSFLETDALEGTVEFAKRSDNSTQITIELSGTASGNSYPAFFNLGTAANPEGILLVLNNVVDGTSVTNIATLTDGSTVSYDELKEFNGNITVHKSNAELGTILLFCDIGANELTSNEMTYEILDESSDAFATLRFIERKNGKALGMIELASTSNTDLVAELHAGTLIDANDLLLQMSPFGEDGISYTDIVTLDNAQEVSYDDLTDMEGNVRFYQDEVYQAGADIGQNELTGRSEEYELPSRTTENISGMATIHERKNESSLVVIEMTGTQGGVNHATHIHQNNALNGGAIVISFNNITGSDGTSQTNITQMDDGTTITFEELLDFDGHIVVHPGTGQFNILATGDIGQNQLTGEFEEYPLLPQTSDNIGGTVVFRQRKNNTTIVEMELTGTTPGSNHATHIHRSTALMGGVIDISFSDVVGNTGISQTNITKMDDGTSITYDELINYDGHVVVHPNTSQLSIVAIGDIGQNSFTGESAEYTLDAIGGSGVSGTVTIHERKSGLAMIEVAVTGTSGGNSHPNHIHENSFETGGAIVLNFNDVNGSTGVSKTDATKFNDGTSVTYDELINFDGHVIVHHHVNFSTIASGNIGSNVN